MPRNCPCNCYNSNHPTYYLWDNFTIENLSPILSPFNADVFGMWDLVQPNNSFFINQGLFVDNSVAGANFDTYAIGTDKNNNPFRVKQGMMFGVEAGVIAQRFDFGISKTITGSPALRFEGTLLSGNMSVDIRDSSGFSAIGEISVQPVRLWLYFGDQLYYGVNNKVINVDAGTPINDNYYLILSRSTINREWQVETARVGLLNPDLFIPNVLAPYTLNSIEQQTLNNFFRNTGGGVYYAAP